MFKISLTRDKALVLLIWVLMLQSLRNANMIFYMGMLVMSYGLLYIKYPIHSLKIDRRLVSWFLLYLLMPLISIINGITLSELITALIRYFALIPMVIWALTHLDIIYDNTKSILKIFVLVTMLSALLMVYQLIFGKIGFFTEVTERVGYSRYSSLLGSPTSYGTLAPLSILILNTWKLFKEKNKMIIQLLIILGGVLSLSKAFFVNIVLCFGLSVIFNSSFRFKIKKKDAMKWVSVIFGILITVIVFYTITSRTIIGDYLNKMINYSFNNQYNGVDTDLINRLTELPRLAFEYYDLTVVQYIFGIGFKGYSGVLGLFEYPMCHNDYFSLILAQGIVFFIIFMIVYVRIIIKCAKRRNSKHNIFCLCLVLYILINMLAGQWNYLTTFNMIFFMIAISNLCCYRRKYESFNL